MFTPDGATTNIGSISLNQFGSSLGSGLESMTYGYQDVVTKIAGQHTIKFGGDYTNLHYLNNPIGRPSYTFYNVWDFLNDAANTESGNFDTATGFPGGARQDNRENLFWRLHPGMTGRFVRT